MTCDFSTRGRPDQHRLPLFVARPDLVDDRPELAALVLVDQIVHVVANDRAGWAG